MALDQSAFWTVGAIQGDSGIFQINENTFSPVINLKTGHANGTEG